MFLMLGWKLGWCGVPAECIRQGVGVCKRGLLFTGKFLLHSKRVVIHHYRHHGGQKACYHLHILKLEKTITFTHLTDDFIQSDKPQLPCVLYKSHILNNSSSSSISQHISIFVLQSNFLSYSNNILCLISAQQKLGVASGTEITQLMQNIVIW